MPIRECEVHGCSGHAGSRPAQMSGDAMADEDLLQALPQSVGPNFAQKPHSSSQSGGGAGTIGASSAHRLGCPCDWSLAILKKIVAGRNGSELDVAVDVSHYAKIRGLEDFVA